MKSVLLVDDDDSNRLVLSVLLEDHGFAVDTCASFKEAQAKIGSDRSPYDVVLLDQHLGDGMGTNLIPAIRARMAGAKVILISGSIEKGGADSAGTDAVSTKGASFPDVLELIERVQG